MEFSRPEYWSRVLDTLLKDQTQVSFIAGGFFISWAAREAQEYWSG